LFDWATSGKLLGPIKAFKDRFAKPIEHARDKNATGSQIRDGKMVNEQLQLKLRPYFLQRLKADYLKDQLPSKVETVVWTHLSDEQRRKYSAYVKGENSFVRAILSGEFGSALEAITWLKMLSSHPLLVDKRFSGDEMKKKAFKGALASMDLDAVVRDSAKLTFAVDLVKQLQGNGHRILVFSQSTRMLDILEAVMRSNRIKASRIDGNTKEKDRQWLVDSFNEKSSSCDVMLLSTKAAGVGITLTGADRVILYDPSWNPASDSQAVDRACTSMRSNGLKFVCPEVFALT
jgi:DNA excision repair protein ERCC-6-like